MTPPRRGRGLEGFTADEVDVLAGALDEYHQAKTYAAALALGDERRALYEKAGLASRLLKRATVEEGRLKQAAKSA